ncbi:chromosome partition protein Smc [Candidatus Methanoplasma termitum]|uniref:Chromosome partition protein Smc n=1 Tax=Candidatus Methanoplasma termitum TaxID=1577791 RepID=A0A0A7LD97_9ARCH|nr:chromosome partition protein Smc [Candidatus Methanoplasma termitum]
MPGDGVKNVYLKQIELENFKSFGGKLTIPLMEGYMAVTGPNGSGKSNITDAILFVLGPKSSKAVRAGKLTDLIFDGGKAKSKAGFTKVSLVFDNADRMMPWDDDIVRLTRYVKISDNGTDYSSYFYVNDRKSSLTEFDSLLTKARISADGYNMVQQGDVTRIVQMGNMDRRRVLDSISGISSYDADIEKAKGERTEAETNLERINIVVEELDKQIEKLEKDKEDAKKYIETQNLLEVAKAQSVHRQMQIEEAKLEGLNAQIIAIDKDIQVLNQRKEAIKAEYAANDIAIKAKEKEIEDRVGPEYREIKDKIEKAKIDMAMQKDRAERANDDIGEHEVVKHGLEDAVNANLAERDGLSVTLKEVSDKLKVSEKKLNDAKAEDAKINEEMLKHGGEHTKLQNRLNDLEAQIDQKEVAEQEAEVSAAKASALAEEAGRSKAALDERLKASDFEIKDAEWNLKEIKQETGGGAEDISKKIMESKRKEAELEKQENELKEAVRRLETQYSELMAEKKITNKFNKGDEAVDAIIELRNKGAASGIHGTVQELATVQPGYETALSVAAGGKMRSVVVNDDQVAADCIAYLKKEKLGRVTFLPLSKMVPGKPRAKAIMTVKQTEGYATDLIDYDQKYANVFWYVFQDTLVVNTMSDARAIMGGIRIVTKGGELLEASGAMTGGTLNTQNIMKFGAASESKLDEVSAKLRAANDSLDGLRAKLKEIRDGIRLMDDEMRKVSGANMGAQAKIGQLTAKISELKRSRQLVSDEFNTKSREHAEAEKRHKDSKKALEEVSALLDSMRSERTELREKIAEIAPAEMQERIQKIRDNVYNFTNDVSELRSQKNSLETEISGLNKHRENLEGQMRTVLKKISDCKEDIERYGKEMERITVELSALRKIETEMESGIKDLRDQRDALVEKGFKLSGEKDSVQDKLEVKTGMRSSNEAQILIVNESLGQLKIEIAEIKVEVRQPIPSEEEIRRTIKSCENVLARIGNVNLRAIEDYEERKARFDSLMADVGKLKTQIKELSDLTESLNSQKKGLFMQSYDAVNTNFKVIYAQLSGGGEAFMGLEDEKDPFLGGLTINAKPKNGKLLRLEALSGGEKSLTALAFIFAIQEYQPSPFYVLDEVDMFLDSVNAEMVAKRVKESSRKAQFIQVSLRKVTLAMADHLIGVTRPPSGISKVIMQPDLAEVSKYEEEALKEQLEQKEDKTKKE